MFVFWQRKAENKAGCHGNQTTASVCYLTSLFLGGFSSLREYLYNRCASPFSECGLDYESVKHFFLFCPRYAAQRNLLRISAARILDKTWSSSSDARKINFFLFGVKSVNYSINCTLFREVQTFIINTNRFSMATVWLFNYTFLVMLI